MRLERKLSALLPPNMAAERVHDWILWSLIAPALVCALAFLCRYREAYDALWYSSYSPHAGELLGIDAFDQPGVEQSKIASYAVLGNKEEKYVKAAEEMSKQTLPFAEYVM